MSRINKSIPFVGIALVAVLALTGCGSTVASDSSEPDTPVIITADYGRETSSPDHKPCVATFPMDTSVESEANHRWFEDGIVEIKEAKDAKTARKAWKAWIAKVETRPKYLAAAYALFTHKTVDPATLVDEKGCATELASQISLEIRALGAAAIITPSEAPSDGFNSGVDGGTVVGSPFPGITGDKTAIKIVLPDGTVIWIMARCGNAVTPGQPYLPPGKTDEKHQWENIDHYLADPFYANGGPTNTVNNNNGATDAQGNQGSSADVLAAELLAAQLAEEARLAREAEAKKAAEDAAAAEKAAADDNKGALDGQPAG